MARRAGRRVRHIWRPVRRPEGTRARAIGARETWLNRSLAPPVLGGAAEVEERLQYGWSATATPSVVAGTSNLLTYDRGISVVALPQPYDFHASTERFRSYGVDRANLWRDGGLHRVVNGLEVRIEPAPGGVRIEPFDDAVGAEVAWLLGVPLDLEGFWAWAERDPVLAELHRPLADYRPPLVPDRWEMLVTSITAQQVSLHSAFAVRSRLIERFGEQHGHVWSFPSRARIAQATEGEIRAVGFSTRKAEYVIGLAHSDLDLDALDLLPDAQVSDVITAQRGLGRWTADWFLARALARPDAWPAGDLGVRKAVSFFYGEGRDLDETEVRGVGERFGRRRNIACHMLLAGARLHG